MNPKSKFPISLFIIFFLMNVSCNDKEVYKFKMNKSILLSPELLPPKSCYRVHVIASGSITCDTKIKLLMDDKETNFMDHVKLKGSYLNTEIYQSDWYQNKFQLKNSEWQLYRR
ncbi:MAG: hypothetical protein IPO98_08030 [Saprospiraceae bacterium]|nr:hypothetical protein [Saprospiraceae bacterium]